MRILNLAGITLASVLFALPMASAGVVNVTVCSVADGTEWIDCQANAPVGGATGVPAATLWFGAQTTPGCGAWSLTSVLTPSAPTLGPCAATIGLGVANASIPTPNPSYLTRDGSGSPDPSAPARLLGNELYVYQMDARDNDQPSSGMTQDASGNGRAATLNGATWTASGAYGGAYTLDGVYQDISVPYSRTAMGSGTIMMWVEPTNLVNGRLFFHQWPGVTNQLGLWLDDAGFVHFQTTNDAANAFQSASPIPVDQWSHIAATWSPTGQILYINGNAVGTSTNTAGVSSSYTQTMIGNSPNDLSTGGFSGSVDEVREYPVALSQSDIQSLANGPYV